MKKNKKLLKNQGFTLVELIIVIAIIAVLAVAAFMMLTKWLGKSRDSRRLSDLGTIERGLQVGYSDVDDGINMYPDIEHQSATYVKLMSGDSIILGYQGIVDDEVAKGAQLQKAPLDPSDGNEYTYTVTENRQKFQLLAMLEDGTKVEAILNSAYALDYSNRYPATKGFELGVLLRASDKMPVQFDEALQGSGVNMMTETSYKAVVSDSEIKEGIEIATAPIVDEDGGEEGEGGAETYSCQGSLVVANADVSNNTGLTGNVSYQNTDAGEACYYSCKGNYAGLDCDTECLESEGFIKIPLNLDFPYSDGTVRDFCVAKYEMSYADGICANCNNTETDVYSATKIPVSAAGNYAIAVSAIADAISSCKLMGDGYHLVTNNEWMTIARSIENTDANWSGGIKGSGYVPNGIADDVSSGRGCGMSGNDGNSIEMAKTGRSGCGKNNLLLANGKEIWDLAGNLQEWVNKTNDINDTDGKNGTTVDMASSETGRLQWSSTSISTANRGSYGPSNSSYNSTNGMGYIYDTVVDDNTLIRGGRAEHIDGKAGIYAMSLHIGGADSGTYTHTGFRCVK